MYADIPLTDAISEAVATAYGVILGPEPARRLHGGEESAAYHAGGYVIRLGPRWRSDQRMHWCHAVAARAAAEVPQFLAPLTSQDGRTVIRAEGRPVTLWRYVTGQWADDRNREHRRQAAVLLARFHSALAQSSFAPSPDPPPDRPDVPEVHDPQLDDWLATFDHRHQRRQPLHGDYYAGNTLAHDGRIVAVLDWDEAYLGPPQREAAHAAWEWGDGLRDSLLDGAREFLASYAAAGGPGAELDEVSLRQLIRERLRAEVRWAAAADQRGTRLDGDDRAYTRRQIDAYWQLRPVP